MTVMPDYHSMDHIFVMPGLATGQHDTQAPHDQSSQSMSTFANKSFPGDNYSPNSNSPHSPSYNSPNTNVCNYSPSSHGSPGQDSSFLGLNYQNLSPHGNLSPRPPPVQSPPKPDPPGKKQRRERTNFSAEQKAVLEEMFLRTTYPDVFQREEICQRTNLPELKIGIWFKNRRAKDRLQGKNITSSRLDPSLSHGEVQQAPLQSGQVAGQVREGQGYSRVKKDPDINTSLEQNHIQGHNGIMNFCATNSMASTVTSTSMYSSPSSDSTMLSSSMYSSQTMSHLMNYKLFPNHHLQYPLINMETDYGLFPGIKREVNQDPYTMLSTTQPPIPEEFDLSVFLSQVNNPEPGYHISPGITPYSFTLPQPSCTPRTASFPNISHNPGVAAMDPFSFIKQETSYKEEVNTSISNQAVPSSSDNPNRHLVPEDLQSLIILQNPTRGIKFTFSQRMNTQMVVDDYVLKKKKGPYWTRGGRVVNWKCILDSCVFTMVTMEGLIQEQARQHNHPCQPQLYIKKQVRARIRENLTHQGAKIDEEEVMNAVMKVVGDTNNQIRENNIGSIDSHKQAARRFKRKLLKDSSPTYQDSLSVINNSQHIINSSHPILNNTLQVINNSHSIFKNSQHITQDYVDHDSQIINPNKEPILQNSQHTVKDSQSIIQNSHSVVQESGLNPPSQAADLLLTPTTEGVVFVPPSVYQNSEVIGEFPADFQFVVALPDHDEGKVGDDDDEGKVGDDDEEMKRTRRQWA